ncbi:MAG: hypothetical protein KGL10_05315 [Alphaproteobacteria bacterium]|nr:hypothetical protein [Alphaproteobacteria bacterium]MDE2336712.1 hypothetical protein [Alphaproteobacteria bacterium]
MMKVEDWEQNHINSLTLKLIFAATLATLAAAGISMAMRHFGLQQIQPDLLFAPWSIALVIGTSVAFHQGVLAERARNEKPEEEK